MTTKSDRLKQAWATNGSDIQAKRAAHPNYSSPERAQRIAASTRERWADPEYRERMSEQLSQKLKGRKPARCLRVVVDGVAYESIAAATRATGLGYRGLNKLAKEQAAEQARLDEVARNHG